MLYLKLDVSTFDILTCRYFDCRCFVPDPVLIRIPIYYIIKMLKIPIEVMGDFSHSSRLPPPIDQYWNYIYIIIIVIFVIYKRKHVFVSEIFFWKTFCLFDIFIYLH